MKKFLIISGIIAGVSVVLFMILFPPMYKKYQEIKKPVLTLTTDINDYGDFRGFRGYSNLDVFPSKIPDSAKNVDFYYHDDSTPLFTDSCQVYLKCTYNEMDYQNEVQRLKVVTEQYKEEIHTAWADNENFKLPSIVAVYAYNHCYEYALLNEAEDSIIYVFLQFIYERDVVFDKDFLPYTYFEPDEEIKKAEEMKSIYLFLDSEAGWFGALFGEGYRVTYGQNGTRWFEQ